MPDKLKSAVAGHEDQVRTGVDKAAEVANEKTQGEYSDEINTAKEKASEQLGGQQPPTEGMQPPAEGMQPPADGTQPPAEGEPPPPEGMQPPAEGEQPHPA